MDLFLLFSDEQICNDDANSLLLVAKIQYLCLFKLDRQIDKQVRKIIILYVTPHSVLFDLQTIQLTLNVSV